MDQPDSNQNGGASLPNVSTSPGGVKPNSVDVDALLAALDDPRVADVLSRRAQSVKDQRIAKQEKQLSSFQEQLERLEGLMKEEGLSKPAAIRRMALEDRLDNLQASLTSTSVTKPAVAQQVQSQSDVDTENFLRSVGIDPNDPDVTALYRNGGATPDALIKLVTQRKTGRNINVAQASPSGSGVSATEDLAAQYKKEMASASPGMVFDIRDKYRGLGLKI